MTDPKDKHTEQRPDEIEGDQLDQVAGGVDQGSVSAGDADTIIPDPHHGRIRAPD